MAKKKILAEHLRVATLKERYWIPQHDKRRTSKKFKKNKQFLRDDVKLACWVCGKKQSKQRPLEVHHIFEWAMWNALDRKRVTRILKVLEFYEDGYKATAGNRSRLDKALDKAWKTGDLRSPDDIRNLVVLCQEHHRLRFTGTHMISFPIWMCLAAVSKDFRIIRKDIVDAVRPIERIDAALADKFEEQPV